jgi:hypothetical protein
VHLFQKRQCGQGEGAEALAFELFCEAYRPAAKQVWAANKRRV